MIPRRFVNLMMKDLRVGGSYWLSRMRLDKNLFYSSAEEAVATETQGWRDSFRPMCESTRSLSSPDFRFKSSRSLDSALGIMPFYRLGGGPSEGRFVVSDSAGNTFMYDADEGSSEMLPPTNTKESSKWHSPISLCIAGPQGSVRADALYGINESNSTNFKCLAYRRGDKMAWDHNFAWDWLELPPPPYTLGGKLEDHTIRSYALLKDDRTICFSSAPGGVGGFGTYCFDTATHEWAKAGSWTLPLVGRALRVPQLHNIYFGFLDSDLESLVALEFPSPLAPPVVLHQWRGFGPTDNRVEWLLMDSNLLYLGNHRFCVAKFFAIFGGSSVELSENLVDMAAVLTGVEILDGQADKAKLQMIKHKTMTYIFERCSIEAVL